MLDQLDVLTTRIGGCNKLVDLWLNTRRQLLVAYYQLVGIKPNKGSLTAFDDVALDNFCQKLVDYLSIGHFNIYQRIINILHDNNPLSAACQIYPALQVNTDQIMEDYDNHLVTEINAYKRLDFQRVLSRLGEALETRFTLEDKLIKLTFDRYFHPTLAANENELVRPA